MSGGIYCIRNLVNGKVYVGSAVDIKRRWWKHSSDIKNNTHENKHLSRAWNKYGEENFIFEILNDEVEPCNLQRYEQDWIDLCRIEGIELYNNLLRAYSSSGYKHTEEAKAKMSLAHKGKQNPEQIKQLSIINTGNKYNLGRTISSETKHKMSESHLQLNIKLTDEHKAKLIRRTRVIQKSLDNEIIKVWDSIKEAGSFLNINQTSISHTCLGRNKTAGGYKWEYYKEMD